MRAFAVRSFGEAPAIQDLPIPNAEGALLIRVSDIGVNPFDYKSLEQLTANSRYPFVLGTDFAGIVERVPAAAIDFRVGDRVFGIAHQYGAYAEYTAVAPGKPVAHTLDGVTDEQAAALPTSGITALGSIELLKLSTNQHLVVMGATGGVGGYTVQVARSRGAHVIATVRGDADEARRLGAEEIYDTKTVDVINAVHAAHPDGVDAVLDLVNGKDVIRRDAEILKPGGNLVSTLFAADEGWFSQRRISAHNISSSTNPFASPKGLTELARLAADGTITVRIGATLALEDAGEMLGELRGGGLRGKTIIRL
jgi:NADPH:quinone reductase-like Zn-dependent oxidoreductase